MATLPRRLLTACLLLLTAAPAAAQPTDAKVKAATRLDWQFVAGQFGADQTKLPADYKSTEQRYQLFVPSNYAKQQNWPLVVFVSPSDKPAGWAAWKQVCEKQGVFFCSPYGAGNDCPTGKRCRIILDCLDDVCRNFNVDPDRTYIAGFSGGGRMACTLGFSLPESFGGIVAICGTNPQPKLTYLKHRIADRLAVAQVTGETDFNRKEHEDYMVPWWQEVGVTTKLWVVPKLGHAIPGGDTMAEVYQWLEAQLPMRQADAKANPKLAAAPGDTADQQAQRLLDAADEALGKPERVWRGVVLLQGISERWPQSAAAKGAKQRIQALLKDEAQLKLVEEQGGAEERKHLAAQAKALERFGQTDAAIRAWELLAKLHPNTPEGKQAAKEAARLKKK
jgi:hypothetical protein